MNILLTADESAGYHAFQLITKSKHNLSGLVAPLNHKPLQMGAEQLNIPVFAPKSLTDPSFAGWVHKNKIDVLLNVHLLYVIHPDIINAVSADAFNIHPGLLPEYAGLNTPSWAIYNHETEQTVTLHRIEEGIDTGSIAYTSTFTINKDDTGFTLSARAAKKGLELISRLLDDLSDDDSSVPAIQQKISSRKYYAKKDKPQNGTLDWNKSSAEIDALIRAFNYQPFKSPWGYPSTKYNGTEIGISAALPTQDSCHQFSPGTIGVPGQNFVPVATKDYWLRVKTCFDGENLVPAHKILKEGKTLS